MSWLLVTPARNEATCLPRLAASLAGQHRCDLVGLWVIVDDGSTDGTSDAVEPAALPFPVQVVRRDNDGGLRRGSAFASFLAGAAEGLALLPDAERVLKLDADVVLDPRYLAELAGRAPSCAGLVGGVIADRREREAGHHVRGGLKAYSRSGFAIVSQLPPAAGFDVVDEVALRRAGLHVAVVPSARAHVLRRTGSSEGLLAGRARAGVVSRWSGYHPAYFALRLARYSVRRPPVVGAVAMAAGWLRADDGPFPPELLAAHRAEQADRLRRLARHPLRWLRTTYGSTS